MSIDISTAPAPGAKPAAAHSRGHGHGKAEQEKAGAFTQLLSGKARQAPAESGHTQAKPAVPSAAKWQARENAQWRVFDAMKNGGRGDAADETDAADPEIAADTEGQAGQAAMLFGHQVKIATAPSGGDHAKEGTDAAKGMVAREGGEQAGSVDVPAQPARKRPAAEGAQSRAAEPLPAGAGEARLSPAALPAAAREDAADASAPKTGIAAPAPQEAAAERGGRVQEREPSGDRAAPKVTVVSVQTTPVPAASVAGPALSPTSASFVQSLGAADGLPRYVSEAGVQGGSQDAKPLTTLKIQLHPVDLGTVTAQLSGDSEKLSIEVHVENQEAHHRLQSDGDAIVKALRGMGFDIDRITIQQAPQTAASPGGGSNRENAFAAPDQRAGDGRGQQARQESSGRGYEQGRNQGGGDRGEARGGVYI